METRLALATDIGPVLRLLAQLSVGDEPPPPGLASETFAEIERNPAMHLFVVDDGNETGHGSKLLATCVLATLPNLTHDCRAYGLIENVVVDAQHRGQGVGMRMMRDVLAHAWQLDCYKVMLLSNALRTEAQSFYRACGFRSDEKQGFVIRRS